MISKSNKAWAQAKLWDKSSGPKSTGSITYKTWAMAYLHSLPLSRQPQMRRSPPTKQPEARISFLEFLNWVFFNAEAKGLFVDLKWSFKGFFFSLETQAEVEWLKELEVSNSKSFLTSRRFPRCHEMKQHEYNTSLYSFQVPLLGLEEPPYGY